ncbi:hypothetical protein BURPS1106B_2630 [Burkholderia pseudomallei 1106b]|uniref:Uncharacterized protein n=2 Tax=pseudomallei group TaxID=111527 RepID=A2S0C2_BURM9|nr:hypothetical protein BMASAVP1_1395 [Burkholderia mallei SAVP1]ABM99154.2 hypothetical protein BMA10229_1591 [Burkholderia mallei NCTC 10229]ABN94301.1 hypothetical protein BURPS1106A_A2545 [Burkholderia pseudomallei 1106a]AFR20431.1 hypothetical protein BPC006_II2506 [Burkholderia pseudomallei BPC006]EBA50414.1 hypothetical protein BURPS305_6095 [Burkholderia pseudomallei 305]EDS83357.1 hypothetical protein BURPSS13_X0686 [Burkholderia pseudomallei S13]EDU12361.1 hypothetical protein BURPS
MWQPNPPDRSDTRFFRMTDDSIVKGSEMRRDYRARSASRLNFI